MSASSWPRARAARTIAQPHGVPDVAAGWPRILRNGRLLYAEQYHSSADRCHVVSSCCPSSPCRRRLGSGRCGRAPTGLVGAVRCVQKDRRRFLDRASLRFDARGRRKGQSPQGRRSLPGSVHQGPGFFADARPRVPLLEVAPPLGDRLPTIRRGWLQSDCLCRASVCAVMRPAHDRAPPPERGMCLFARTLATTVRAGNTRRRA